MSGRAKIVYMRKFALVIGLVVIAGGWLWLRYMPYDVAINSENFVAHIDNPYFTLKAGTTFTYQSSTSAGFERNEVSVSSETRMIMGVRTVVVRDTVWIDDSLHEDTRDYYAQDKHGNVWYFGEAVDNYERNTIANHEGAWEAGIDGAKPGIVMEAQPKVGDSYRQEYAPGTAEDMGFIVAVGQTVQVPYGTLTNCLKTWDWSRIELFAHEFKYYCPTVGFVVLEKNVFTGARAGELVKVK